MHVQYDEKSLLLAMAEGDEGAFERIYQHYQSNIYNYVLKVVKSRQLAEDLQQEIFVKIWERRASLPKVRSFDSFLFTVARNHTIDAMRSVTRLNIVLADVLKHFTETDSNDVILHRDYDRFIQKVLQLIPARAKEIYRKCKEEGKTYEEVATELGISGNAVKRHMVNTIKTLQDAAGKDLDLSPDMLILLLIYCMSVL